MSVSREKRQINSWCKICKIKPITPYGFQVHENHEKCQPKRFFCDFCGRSYSRKWNLKKHFQQFHGKKFCQGDMKFQCSVCSRKLKYVKTLSNHMKIYHKTKICSLCNKIFNGYNAYKFHRCEEFSEPPKNLPESPVKTKRIRWKNNRAPLYETRKKYPCDQCLKSYFTKSWMRFHRRKEHPMEIEPSREPSEMADVIPIPPEKSHRQKFILTLKVEKLF
ncbi:hypothetical protein DMENIID0001_169280 [Sergentomyia squamirostris]